MAKKKLSRLAEKALQAHIRQRQAVLRAHRKLKPESWAGIDPEYREWWEQRLRSLEMAESVARDGPIMADHSYGSVIEWMQAKQAEQAAIDAAVAGALRRRQPSETKRQRNIRMAREYLARKGETARMGKSRLKEQIGAKEGLKRRQAIDAIDAGLEIITRQKIVR
jgi:hypothetical protein